MIMVEKESNIQLELLSALGNMVYNNELNVSIAKDMDVSSTCDDVKAECDDPDDMKDITGLKNYMVGLLK
jgi:hypothetical protein